MLPKFNSHRNTCLGPSGVIHALHYNAIEFLNHRETRGNLIRTQFVNIINKSGVASGLLFCRFRPFSEMPGNAASAKNGDDSTEQPTERTISKHGCAKYQHNGVEYGIDTAVEYFAYTLKLIAIPYPKNQSEPLLILSWLGVHIYLILIIFAAFAFFWRGGGFSRYVKFIRIGHEFTPCGGDGYARSGKN